MSDDESNASDQAGKDLDFDQPSVQVVYPLNEETEVPMTKAQLFKTVLTEGTPGTKPPNGAKVAVHYVGTLASDGSKFDSSRDRGDLFEFTIGKGQVIKGWDTGVATMNKGEKCILRCLPEYAYGANGSPPKIPANATLNFEVELFDWTKSEDISDDKDKTLMKSVLVEGKDYEKPDYETKVTIDFDIMVPSTEPGKPGKVLTSKPDWTLVVGEADLPVGLENALKSMKRGEEAIILVAASAVAEDDATFADYIKKGVAHGYRILLKEFTKVKTWEYKGAAKVDAGRQRKDQGNEYFKAKQYARAIAKYKRSLEFIEHEFGLEDDAQKAEAKVIKVSCFNNIAQCEINQGNWHDAITYCDKTLTDEPNNAKALFRRGKCHNAMDAWEPSRADLRKVLELDPTNGDAAAELKRVEEKVRAHRQKEKALFGNLFEKMSKMEEREEKKAAVAGTA